MKKRMLALLVCVMLCGMLATTAAGDDLFVLENLVDLYDAMYENDWYGTTTDQERIDMAWELLHIFRYAGYPVGSIPSNDFAQAMNDYYDQDKTESVWSVALFVLGTNLEEMGETGFFPQYYIQDYEDMGVIDWYGTTTDDERIAMAGDILNLFRVLAAPVAAVQNHELAQAMNDYYDQDNSQSVWEVASLTLVPMLQEGDVVWMPYDYSTGDAPWYQALYEPDWYGTTTDDERIDMAWELLTILRHCGYSVGHTCPNDFAQAMNDYYDQDKSLSVWDVAIAVL